MREFGRKLGSFFLDILQTVVLALSIFVVSYLFLLQPHQVRGSSMNPNFENNDFLLTDKISYRLREPQRGEVIIFKAPPTEPCSAEECEYIKRIIGLPQETIKIQDGQIIINDQKLTEDYLLKELRTTPGYFLSEDKAVTLGKNEYLVFGDNRTASRDAREFGPIKKAAIIGRALFRYWPPSEIGLVPKAHFY